MNDLAEAEDNLLQVQSKKEEVYRRLLASNLTSVPERFIIMKNEIDHEVRDVNEQFSERPIHVKQVKKIKVSKIVIQMNTFEDEANDVLVNAVYAEKLIQYGNRYRKDYSNVDKSLNEAERLFKIIAISVRLKLQSKLLKVLSQVSLNILKKKLLSNRK